MLLSPHTLQRIILIGSVSACLLSSTGCLGLSIGGKNYTNQVSPEFEARVTGLETRVSALEQSMTGTPASTTNSWPPGNATAPLPAP